MSGTPDAPSPADPAERARSHTLDTHAEVIEGVLASADAVAEGWPTLQDGRHATSDRTAVVPPLRAGLGRTGLLGRLPTVLQDAVNAAGYDLPAPPVPAPPYVAVTSTGPVLRATVSDGRLVLSMNCFSVDKDASTEAGEALSHGGPRGPVVYARTAKSPAAALSVEFHAETG